MKEIEFNKGKLAVREGGQLRLLNESAELETPTQPKAGAEAERCYLRAIKLLAIRPRSTSELKTLLKKAKFVIDIIDTTITRLTAERLLDDAAFAAYWRDNRTEFRPRSRRAISIELRQKGVANDVAAETVDVLNDDDLAYRSAATKASKLPRLDDEMLKAKLLDFLKRRGFSWETSLRTVKRIIAEEHDK